MNPRKSKQGVAALRRIEVAKLFIRGWSYREMAAFFDVCIATIQKDVTKILENWAQEMRPAERHKWLLKELRKLDSMEKAVADDSEQGDRSAIDRRLAIMEKRAKLLGLNSAVKIRVADEDIDAAIVEELKKLSEANPKQLPAPEDENG